MPILDTELIWKTATLISDTLPAQNGGRMGATQSVTGVKNNLFPDVPSTERAAGSVKFRKAFIHVASQADVPFQTVQVYLDATTPGDSFVTLHAGTETDTEDQVTARAYGVATLVGSGQMGATSLTVRPENITEYTTLQPFRAGDKIRIAETSSMLGAQLPTPEFKTLTAVTYGALEITLEFTGAPLVHSYWESIWQPVIISALLERASVVAEVSAWTETSATGTYDEITVGNVIAHNKGAIAQNWSLRFTSSTAFEVSGDIAGALLSGSINADYAPVNPSTNSPFFTLKSAGWGGTWAVNNTITFTTRSATFPLWYRRKIPAGSNSISNDYASVVVTGESL